VSESTEQTVTASGIPVKTIYTPKDLNKLDYDKDLGIAGQPPFTRGPYTTMYRGQTWTIRRLSGYNTPEDSNKLYREEYALGQTGFSVAPDISTAIQLDADDPRVEAEIGHSGLPLNTIEDVETAFKGLPIDKVSTYLAERGPITAMYFAAAEKWGMDLKQLRGTTSGCMLSWACLNIPLQPPPTAYRRYGTDFVEWCAEVAPKWNPINFDSYNPRDLGLNAYEELGVLFACAIDFIEEEKRRGRIPLDRFVKKISFNTAAHNDFFEEIAKLRAARRMWYKIVAQRYGIQDPNCAKFRVHVQSSGSTHTYQEPYNNLIRIAYQTLAAVLGGAQSIHANGYDEAVCLPTEQSMLLSIRTEQIAALETNVTNTIDPLGGSYYVESLTNELEERAFGYIKKIEDMGGMAQAMESGWYHNLLKEKPIERQAKIESGKIPIVGVNIFRADKAPYKVPIFRPDPAGSQKIQAEKLRLFREKRDKRKYAEAMKRLVKACKSDENVYPYVFEAVKAGATLGEVSKAQLDAYGEWPYPIGL
jgi:methylmalonyl-CoA mutase N-terminal domain/subunit